MVAEIFQLLKAFVLGLPDMASSQLIGVQSKALQSVGSLIVMVTVYFLARYIARVASTPIRQRIDETLGRFVNKLIFYGAMTCAVVTILGIFGYEVASFTSVLAAVGFAVGLAFQGTLSSFAAGVLLLVFRPFKVGDSVVAAGVSGKVYEIDLFTTVIDTSDNRRIIIPNSAISGATIENASYHKHKRVEVNVGVEYKASLDETRSALTLALASIQSFVIDEEDRGHQVVLSNLGPSSVDWLVRAWVTSADASKAREQLIYAVKTQLDAAGIAIPFPQLDIHLSSNSLSDIVPDESNAIKMRPRLRQPELRRAA